MSKSNNNIVFFGATELGYNCCQRLIDIGVNITGIFTIPKAFNISYSPGKPVNNVLHKDFYELGERYSIPVISVEGRMDAYKDELARLKPDLLVVVGWYYLVPKVLRSIAPLGCVGIHGSLLPKYRGGAPLVWSMINGEKETGLSLFYFDDGVDTGDIVAQHKFPIADSDTIKDLLKKLEYESLSVIEEHIPKILNGSANRTVQNNLLATSFPQRKPEDGEINWEWDNEQIKNFIRAQTKPYPGAFTIINGKKLVIWDADLF